MADSDLALAISIAENGDCSFDDDFQVSAHADQLCVLNKFANAIRRPKKDRCSSNKKVSLQKPRRTSTEGKENQCKSNRKDGGVDMLQCKFADPYLSQVRKPLATRKTNAFNKRTLPSFPLISNGGYINENAKEAEAITNTTYAKVSCSPAIGLQSNLHAIEVCETAIESGYNDRAKSPSAGLPNVVSIEGVILEAPKNDETSLQKDIDEGLINPRESQQGVPKVSQIHSPRPTSQVYPSVSKDDNHLFGFSEEDAAFSSMEDAVSLAEEEGTMAGIIMHNHKQFELPGEEQGMEMFESNINPDSQFNALLKLISDNDKEDGPYIDMLGRNSVMEDSSVLVEELISSLMTQGKCRDSMVFCDASLQNVDSQPFSAGTENFNTHSASNFQKLHSGSERVSFEADNSSDHEQTISEGRLYINGALVHTETEVNQRLDCPVCGTCITGLSFQQREEHTNACLDSISRNEVHHCNAGISIIDMDESKVELGECVQEPSLVDLAPVVRWLEALNLSRYANIFIREEIDWDTLKCLSDDDLCTLGITALGPRKKILHAIQQLGKQTNENVSIINDEPNGKQHVEMDGGGRTLITDFYQIPPSLQGTGASVPQNEPSNRGKGERSRAMPQKRALRELGGIPEWMSIPGTQFRVDAFQHLKGDCSHWFLTHFHTDHYQGLTRAFRYGHIYCSPITAQLVNTRIGVPWERLKPIPLNDPVDIDGVKVTFIEANHCPGSVMILFEPKNGKAVLHTGDFRFCEEIAAIPVLQTCQIHTLMLDTTYCNPQYDFPKQEATIQFIIEAIQAEAFNPSTLFLIGTYTVGKERIFFEVAKALQQKIYCSATKLRLLQCMNFPNEDMKWLTTNDQEAAIHIVPLWSIASFKRMSYIARHNHVFSIIL
ncbi:hypothetical protein KP509_39G017300 [Ceratopteris richardii]|uniref:SAM domain-containing protein n=1 Tax=Ceratopteris richardii TaxID=49495 RepID=A0A8T2PZ77_CERRI|nr:hypothetical protein KP509_39G017300 [Ceratopteris richardii]